MTSAAALVKSAGSGWPPRPRRWRPGWPGKDLSAASPIRTRSWRQPFPDPARNRRGRCGDLGRSTPVIEPLVRSHRLVVSFPVRPATRHVSTSRACCGRTCAQKAFTTAVLGERYRVAVRIRDLHVADTVRVSLDWFMFDTFGSQALQERVESGNGEGDPARARPRRVRLNEECGVLVDVPEDFFARAQVRRSPEQPRDQSIAAPSPDTGTPAMRWVIAPCMLPHGQPQTGPRSRGGTSRPGLRATGHRLGPHRRLDFLPAPLISAPVAPVTILPWRSRMNWSAAACTLLRGAGSWGTLCPCGSSAGVSGRRFWGTAA